VVGSMNSMAISGMRVFSWQVSRSLNFITLYDVLALRKCITSINFRGGLVQSTDTGQFERRGGGYDYAKS
jgi:hypothetical protein